MENNEKKMFVIFKRCNKASGFIHLPSIDRKLQYASFPEYKTTELKTGDIVNTAKGNQVLVIGVLDYDPSKIFNVEKSSFDVDVVLDNVLETLDRRYIVPQGEKDIYVIHGRSFTYQDFLDSLKALGFSESMINMVNLDESNKYVYMPTYLYNLLGTIQEKFFDEIVEDA